MIEPKSESFLRFSIRYSRTIWCALSVAGVSILTAALVVSFQRNELLLGVMCMAAWAAIKWCADYAESAGEMGQEAKTELAELQRKQQQPIAARQKESE